MKTAMLAGVFVAALPILASAQTSTSGSMSAPSGSSMSSTSTALSAQDKLFIKQAAYAGIAEVSDGNLAERKGSPTVKQVGTRMVTDHTKLNDQLAALSQQLGDPAPTMTDAAHMKMHAMLAKLSGTAFDTHYLREQKLGHEKTIALFKREASDGSNSQLKDLANNALPILNAHLQMIESASGTSAKAENTAG